MLSCGAYVETLRTSSAHDAMPVHSMDPRWGRKVSSVCRSLLLEFGPFLVRDTLSKSKTSKATHSLLTRFEEVRGALLASEPMAARLRDADMAHAYVLWANDRIGASRALTPVAAARSLKALATRYGLERPLFFGSPAAPSPRTWAADACWIDEFVDGLRAPRPRPRSRSEAPHSGAPKPEPKGKPKRAPIPTALRHAVWNAWVEGGARSGEGPCACCARLITQQDFECGHVVAAACGGAATVDNLRPVCRSCNRSMGTTDLTAFVALYFPRRRPDDDDEDMGASELV
jgi:hypothetical protein